MAKGKLQPQKYHCRKLTALAQCPAAAAKLSSPKETSLLKDKAALVPGNALNV